MEIKGRETSLIPYKVIRRLRVREKHSRRTRSAIETNRDANTARQVERFCV